MKRDLSRREVKAIKSYGLAPKIEQKVWDVWSQKKKPNVPAILPTIFYALIANLIMFGSTAALWTNYFVPEITYFQGIINVIVFFFWILMPCIVFFTAIQLTMVHAEENYVFTRSPLKIWHKKIGLKVAISRINNIALIIGFVLNGRPFLAFIFILCWIASLIMDQGIKSHVQEKMDEIIIA